MSDKKRLLIDLAPGDLVTLEAIALNNNRSRKQQIEHIIQEYVKKSANE